MTVESPLRTLGFWNPPAWATETDTGNDTVADYLHLVGEADSIKVLLAQSDELSQDDGAMVVCRSQPAILVAGERLGLPGARKLHELLTMALDLHDRAALPSSEAEHA